MSCPRNEHEGSQDAKDQTLTAGAVRVVPLFRVGAGKGVRVNETGEVHDIAAGYAGSEYGALGKFEGREDVILNVERRRVGFTSSMAEMKCCCVAMVITSSTCLFVMRMFETVAKSSTDY